MLGIQQKCSEVKHQVLSGSCYARIVLRVALKEKFHKPQASVMYRRIHSSPRAILTLYMPILIRI